MSSSQAHPSTPAHPTPPEPALATSENESHTPTVKPFDGQGPAGLACLPRPAQVPEERWWLQASEGAEQDLMQRILIASPWERYRLDRDAARPSPPEDRT